ncbi:uncharacterized protein PAC_15502 [Phialocephala subalpina]|uniref:non-specific serine/threonine protein kinase n=1 Tax=Phialocephala subalpina TaxID=576137 RepID=A0A1L7XKN7_9HELO|nr:uncharacterized protein PAC_15502 [Phialocephala subalpina]
MSQPCDSDGDSIVSSETSTLTYEQESFSTFRLKVIQLCIDIGLGTPSEVDRMTGGGFNRVIGVALTSPDAQISRYIIRIPRLPLDEVEVQNIKDQVAVLLYLSKYLPVAEVKAYDCTSENAIESQYVIQQRLPGKSVETVYETLTLEERLQLATSVADLVQRIDSVILPQFGRLVQNTPMPDVSHDVSQFPRKEIDVAGYRLDVYSDMPTTNEQNLASLLRVMCKARSEDDAEDEELRSFWQRLQKMITEMELLSLLSNMEEPARLGHWDLSARNLLVEKVEGLWKVSGVLDWDDAMSVPGVISRKPPIWLWSPEVRVEEADLAPPIELTGDQREIKEKFDEVTTSIPSYQDDAYHSGRWLRRLWAFALHGFTYSQDWDRYGTLVQDWDEYRQGLKHAEI